MEIYSDPIGAIGQQIWSHSVRDLVVAGNIVNIDNHITRTRETEYVWERSEKVLVKLGENCSGNSVCRREPSVEIFNFASAGTTVKQVCDDFKQARDAVVVLRGLKKTFDADMSKSIQEM